MTLISVSSTFLEYLIMKMQHVRYGLLGFALLAGCDSNPGGPAVPSAPRGTTPEGEAAATGTAGKKTKMPANSPLASPD